MIISERQNILTPQTLSALPSFDRVPAVAIPARPDITWLPLRALFVNEAYQRDILGRGQKVISKIAADFQWARFGIVTVMDLEDGRFAILDGQHRSAAMKSMGADAVPCLIVPKGDLKTQAAHFIGINATRTAMTPVAKFKARIMAEDEAAIAVKAFIEDTGVKPILYNPNPKKVVYPSINSLNAVEELWTEPRRRPILRRAIIVGAMTGKALISGRLLRVIYYFLADASLSADFDNETIGAAIKAKGANLVCALSSEHRAETGDTLADSGALTLWRVVMDYVEARGATP